MPAASHQYAVERHGQGSADDRRPGGRRPADRTFHHDPHDPAHALLPFTFGASCPSPRRRVLGVDVSPVVILAVIAAVATTPAGVLVAEAAQTTGEGTIAVISAVATVLGGIAGVLATAWKTNGTLRSQIQRDARAWIKAQSEEISELRQDVADLAAFRDDVVTFLAQDKAWQTTVLTLLSTNGISAPAPPLPPTLHHSKSKE